MTQAGPHERRHSIPVDVGCVTVGGGSPIVVQSMTNTDTADVEATTRQVAALARAGSEIVRVTVDRNESAAAVPRIKERLEKIGINVPIVGDFHYIGQCGIQGKERPPVRRHHRNCDQAQQTRSYWSQLGFS